jgi:hypothetical protein
MIIDQILLHATITLLQARSIPLGGHSIKIQKRLVYLHAVQSSVPCIITENLCILVIVS